MDLPDDSIGVSDLLDWAECPRRMSYKLRRFGPAGEPPESAINPTKLFGAAVHDAIEFIEATGASNDEAIQHITSNGHRWMDLEVVEEIKADLDVHRSRDKPLDWELIWNEREIRMPLMTFRGGRIYYRARIDRLYRHRRIVGLYWLRDSKTTRWRRTQRDVDEDKQMSAYDLSVRWLLPEVEELRISYDQLAFGEVWTERSDDDRRKITGWLKRSAIAVLEDEEYGPDGLLVPEFNQWCPYCPIMESCAVIPMLSDYALATIAKLAPERKDGRKVRPELDPDIFDVYVEQLDRVSTAKGVLERFEKSVKGKLRELPQAERERLGYRLSSKTFDVFSPEAMRAAHRLLGDSFYEIVSMSKEAVTRAVGSDKEKLDLIIGMADKRPGAQFVAKRTGPRRR